MKDKFLSEEDLDLRNLSLKERISIWNAWLKQAQITNYLDEHVYSHSCFGYGVKIEFKKGKKRELSGITIRVRSQGCRSIPTICAANLQTPSAV